jgi:hypothetical protein
MKEELTECDREVLLHALGGSSLRPGQKLGWRNYFCTGPGTDDFITCERLVRLGLMRLNGTVSWVPDGFFYGVTDAGKRAVGCEVDESGLREQAQAEVAMANDPELAGRVEGEGEASDA